MNINREFIALWADTLESGEYPQTRGWLHRLESSNEYPEGYCCVGVACVLAGIKGELDGTIECFANHAGSAPEELVRIAGPDVDWGDLYERNDGRNGQHKHSFAEIAAHLRKTYLS